MNSNMSTTYTEDIEIIRNSIENHDAHGALRLIMRCPSIVHEIMKSKTDSSTWDTLLHYACRTGNQEIVTILLDFDSDINTVDSNGFTPIMISVLHQHEEIVRKLLKYGADSCLLSSNTVIFTIFTILL